MLTVIATITAKSGKVAEVRRELDKLILATRREKGCINYDLHVSLNDACSFVFYENWESGEALRAHAESAHMRAWAKSRIPLLAAPVKVQLFHMLSSPA